ncbi:hypothetical protein PBAL39_14924 [Pedobacter sp. BAL39]|uniref:iron-sulfur cluster repair di-iron protein n=1 Tax=Pedobacter sp. BAL39 TaxID=391596 RepID=UPI00015598C5|nr:iron-sulfur cluster repair di-iron protein [Pedobacter sp. BAL39]EDM37728.1 hypothetical protein PBAL39_14924 [Pedobacter sp. BAL39]
METIGILKKEETIGEIVTSDFRKAQVFKSFGIDFCCGGKKTVAEVCEKKGINPDTVINALNQLNAQDSTTENEHSKWNIAFLAEYIVNTHHEYVKENIPFMTELAEKVARVHGAEHPELVKVAELFGIVANELISHLMKEERMLFPFIKELHAAQINGTQIPPTVFGDVSNPIQMMESEHEQAGDILRSIREITNNFALPQEACNSYTILFKKLEEFENDLHRHVHLENNILFPKTLAVKKELESA